MSRTIRKKDIEVILMMQVIMICRSVTSRFVERRLSLNSVSFLTFSLNVKRLSKCEVRVVDACIGQKEWHGHNWSELFEKNYCINGTCQKVLITLLISPTIIKAMMIMAVMPIEFNGTLFGPLPCPSFPIPGITASFAID